MTAPRWNALAACNDHPTDLWFPEDGVSPIPAKRICNTCPVKVACLADAIARREDESGIWGGAGGEVRRWLARLHRTSPHPDDGPRDGCDCRFCGAIREHWERLKAEAENGRAPAGAPERFGPNATCGTVAKYVRGCRCRPCRFAMSARNITRRLDQERTA